MEINWKTFMVSADEEIELPKLDAEDLRQPFFQIGLHLWQQNAVLGLVLEKYQQNTERLIAAGHKSPYRQAAHDTFKFWTFMTENFREFEPHVDRQNLQYYKFVFANFRRNICVPYAISQDARKSHFYMCRAMFAAYYIKKLLKYFPEATIDDVIDE